jgi:hypothetical protein
MSNEIEKKLQDQLRRSEDGLDAPTLARLHAARNRALDLARSHREPRWAGSWLTAATAAGVAAIALFVAIRQPADTGQLAATEFESTLLAAASNDIISPVTEEPGTGAASASDTAETLDLLENLDFYEWLSEVADREQQT